MSTADRYEQIGQDIAGAHSGQLFGKPCFNLEGKPFICFFQEEMVFKLSGPQRIQALALEGAQLFDPSGRNRPMKEWIQVPYVHQATWPELAAAAAQYVKSQKTRMQ